MLLFDKVKARLETLHYINTDTDNELIIFCIESVIKSIKNTCNLTDLPEELEPAAVNIICGEFLINKKNSGNLTGFKVDMLNPAVKRIQEGDTNVEYAFNNGGDMSPEERLNILIERLLSSGKSEFLKFRRLEW